MLRRSATPAWSPTQASDSSKWRRKLKSLSTQRSTMTSSSLARRNLLAATTGEGECSDEGLAELRDL